MNVKIYLLDQNPEMARALRLAFAGEEAEVVCADFEAFMSARRVECVVSPANSFGLMDGGYDAAITRWFGDQLQERVRAYIWEHFRGEQPVGSAFIIDAGMDGQKLIHVPTMRVPSRIRDPEVVYQAMRVTLMTALENRVSSIVIPVFGGAAGGVRPALAADMMLRGYRQVLHPRQVNGWGDVGPVEEL